MEETNLQINQRQDTIVSSVQATIKEALHKFNMVADKRVKELTLQVETLKIEPRVTHLDEETRKKIQDMHN